MSARALQERERRAKAILPRAVVMVVLLMMAFMSILPGDDAMSVGLTPSRIWEMGLSAVAAAVGIVSRLHGDFRKLPTAALVAPLIVMVYMLWALFTLLWAPLIIIGVGRALQMIMIVIAAYCIVSLPERAPGNGDPNVIVNSLALGMLIAVAALLAANVGLHGTPFPFEGESDNPLTGSLRPRLYLGVNHPLESAGFLGLTILAVAPSSFRPAFKLPVIAGLAVLLYFTDGRTAMAATALSLVTMQFMVLPPSPLKVFVAIVILVSLIGGVLLMIAFGNTDRFLSTAIGEDVFTLNGRVALWEYALGAFTDHPVIGVGYYNSRIVLLEAFPFAGHTHNSLIEIMLATGLPGLLLALLFLFACLFAAVRTGDRLLAGLLVISVIDGALNPLLFQPSVNQALLVIATMRAFAVHGRRVIAPMRARVEIDLPVAHPGRWGRAVE